MKIKIILSLSLLFIACTACKVRQSTVDMPDVGFPAEEMNKQIRLQAPQGWNNFKIGDLVMLAVEVTGSSEVEFPMDYGARMFIKENGKWIEVEDFTTYQEGHLYLSPAKGDPFKIGGAGVRPILPEKDHPITLRIILIGNIYENNQITDEKVAAYIDVQLKP
jgi:hypothetical protein